MFEAPEFEAPLLDPPALPLRLHCTAPAASITQADVAVIGGGLAGLCSALFLARDGHDVVVLERDEAGMAASTANAGSLHVQLLSYDFEPGGPEDGGPAVHTLPLAPRSIALWKEFAIESGEDLGVRQEGGLCWPTTKPILSGCGRINGQSAPKSKATSSVPMDYAHWRRHSPTA